MRLFDGGAPLIVRDEDVIALANVNECEFNAVCDSELAEIERRGAPTVRFNMFGNA